MKLIYQTAEKALGTYCIASSFAREVLSPVVGKNILSIPTEDIFPGDPLNNDKLMSALLSSEKDSVLRDAHQFDYIDRWSKHEPNLQVIVIH